MGPNPEENDVTGEVGGNTDGQGEWVSLPHIFCGLSDNAKEVIVQRPVFSDRRERLSWESSSEKEEGLSG